MKKSYAVLGLGTLGYQVAVNLQEGGAEVLAMDIDPAKIERIGDRVATAVCADLKNEQVLRKFGAYDVDAAIVSMPDHFDVTVLLAYFLKKAGVREILVEVKTEDEANATAGLGAATAIFPALDTANRLTKKLLMPDLADYIPLTSDFFIVEIPCPALWAGKSLLELDIRK